MSLEGVSLMAPFTFGELVEALTCFRHVELIVDEWGDLQALYDWFSPQGWAAFLDEFHETVRIRVQTRTFESHTRGTGYISFQFNLMNDTSVLSWNSERGGLSFTQPHMTGIWISEAAQRTMRRYTSIDLPEFVPALMADPDDLTRRFQEYLRMSGWGGDYPRVVRLPELEYTGWRGLEFEGGTDEAQVSSAFNSFMRDLVLTLYAEQSAYPSLSPTRVSMLVGADARRLVASAQRAHTEAFLLQSVVLPHGRAIAEACNEVVPRRWTEPVPATQDVLRRAVVARRARLELDPAVSAGEILRKLSEGDWIDRLPSRAVRWSLFTAGGLGVDAMGAGGAGVLGGLSLSAFDAFLLDRVLAGWRPSRYFLQYRDALAALPPT